jgi:hypothetical protein
MRSSDTLLCRGLVEVAEGELVSSDMLARVTLRLLTELDPTSDELEQAAAAALWRASPPVAARLEVPWAPLDEHAAARCETSLGWNRDSGRPPSDGGRVDQLFLAMEPEGLSNLQRELALVPRGFLDPAELPSATFERLLAQHGYPEGDAASPRNWYFRWRRLLRDESDPALAPLLKEHVSARLPHGTEEWAALPCVTLVAAAHIAANTRASEHAMTALDEALVFAPRLVVHDLVLAVVLARTGAASRCSTRCAQAVGSATSTTGI